MEANLRYVLNKQRLREHSGSKVAEAAFGAAKRDGDVNSLRQEYRDQRLAVSIQ